MRILEIMSFDPSWFLTIPGLLISGGVLLLLIALIVFIATSKKEKGAVVDPTVDGSIPVVGGVEDINNDMDNVAPMGMNNMANNGMGNNPMGINDLGPVPNNGVVDIGMNSINPTPTPTVPDMTVEPQVMPNFNMGTVPTPVVDNTVSPEPVIPTNANISFDNVPQATINDTVNPEMQPVIDLGSVSPNPVVDFNQNVEVPQAPSVEASGPSARPIYGGANPLENTASIPTVLNHSAYNGEPIIPNSVMNEVKVPNDNLGQSVSSNTFVPNKAEIPATETIVAPTPVEVPTEPINVVNPVPTIPTVEPVAPTVNTNANSASGIETLDF